MNAKAGNPMRGMRNIFIFKIRRRPSFIDPGFILPWHEYCFLTEPENVHRRRWS